MNTHIPNAPRPRALRSLRGRLAAAATAGALALGAAAWSGNSAPPAAAADVATNATERVVGAGIDSYSPVVARVSPAVVTVYSERRARFMPTQLPPELREFFRDRLRPDPAPERRQGGLGSGVIVDTNGYILTNHHVVSGAEKVEVELTDRRRLEAQIVGTDQPSDLAVLKVDASALPVVALGDSQQVNVGDVVLALGNPLGVGQTVTLGIISAKGRATGLGDGSFEDFLQTDAPINTGNSGGALVNTRGELIGINSQILSPSGGNIGIGFAIPVDMAQNVMRALIEDGRVRRGRLGVTAQGITSDLARSLRLERIAGALVSNVDEGSPADRAGLRRGDVITGVNGEAIADSNELRNRVARLGPGARAELTIVRDGREEKLTATLEELPSASDASRPSDNAGGDAGAAGLTVEPLSRERARQLGIDDGRGLVVTRVAPGSAAAEAGLRGGDVIREVDGRTPSSADELRSALSAGDRPALVLVQRDQQSIFLTIERRSN